MKLLRNPMVVGILVLLALVVIGVQLWPLFNRSTAPSRPAAVPAPEPVPQPVTPPPLPAKNQAAPSIDIAALEAQALGWTTSPGKDPFQTRAITTATQSSKVTVPPAREVLTLNAIWRQTQGNLAVINNQVVVEGDRVQDFKIGRIDPDSVWVDGPNGREQIVFASAAPAPAKAPQPAMQPQR